MVVIVQKYIIATHFFLAFYMWIIYLSVDDMSQRLRLLSRFDWMLLRKQKILNIWFLVVIWLCSNVLGTQTWVGWSFCNISVLYCRNHFASIMTSPNETTPSVFISWATRPVLLEDQAFLPRTFLCSCSSVFNSIILCIAFSDRCLSFDHHMFQNACVLKCKHIVI